MALVPRAKSLGKTVKTFNPLAGLPHLFHYHQRGFRAETAELGRVAPGTGEETDSYRRKRIITQGGVKFLNANFFHDALLSCDATEMCVRARCLDTDFNETCFQALLESEITISLSLHFAVVYNV